MFKKKRGGGRGGMHVKAGIAQVESVAGTAFCINTHTHTSPPLSLSLSLSLSLQTSWHSRRRGGLLRPLKCADSSLWTNSEIPQNISHKCMPATRRLLTLATKNTKSRKCNTECILKRGVLDDLFCDLSLHKFISGRLCEAMKTDSTM